MQFDIYIYVYNIIERDSKKNNITQWLLEYQKWKEG